MTARAMTGRERFLLMRFAVLSRTPHARMVAPDDLETGVRVLERWRREGAEAPLTEAERAAIIPAVAVMEDALRRSRPEAEAA